MTENTASIAYSKPTGLVILKDAEYASYRYLIDEKGYSWWEAVAAVLNCDQNSSFTLEEVGSPSRPAFDCQGVRFH